MTVQPRSLGSEEVHAMMRLVRDKCVPLLGPDATHFMVDSMAQQAMIADLGYHWRQHHLSKGVPKAALEAAEDGFLEYMLKCQLCTLRLIMDRHMVVNENRRAAFPYIEMSLSAMPFEAALEDLADEQSNTLEIFEGALIPKPTSVKPH